jgi:hypothetical protein
VCFAQLEGNRRAAENTERVKGEGSITVSDRKLPLTYACHVCVICVIGGYLDAGREVVSMIDNVRNPSSCMPKPDDFNQSFFGINSINNSVALYNYFPNRFIFEFRNHSALFWELA